MRASVFVITCLALMGCQPDETLSGYVPDGAEYRLEELNGLEAPARLDLRITKAGDLSGEGPCNRFSGKQTAPYPWFELGPLLMTKRACPNLQAEGQLMAALSSDEMVIRQQPQTL